MRKPEGASVGERGFQNDDGVTKIYEQWQGPQCKEPELTT